MGVAELTAKVVAQAAGGAMTSAGIPGGGEVAEVIEPLLDELLHVQDEQAEAIARIDANVQRLIDGPWETARTYIEEAAVAQVGPEERADKLRNASVALHSAVPLQPDGTLQRAYACLQLAVVERMLGDVGSSVLQARRGPAGSDVLRHCRAEGAQGTQESQDAWLDRARCRLPNGGQVRRHGAQAAVPSP